MLAKSLALRRPIINLGARSFAYDIKETRQMNNLLQRKVNIIKMFTKEKEFNYEQPRMTYDKATGEVTIHKTSDKLKTRKYIRNLDDVETMKAELFKDWELEEDGLPKEGTDLIQLKERIKKTKQREYEEILDVDPSVFYAMSTDYMRVDIGLMIQRPPIFVRMRDQDMEFIIKRQKLMNEYHVDQKQFLDEFQEVSKMNEDVLSSNPYTSRMNIDNYITHRMKNEETGEYDEYCAASKYWQKVDPNCDDPKSLHYAGEERTYLIVKNKYTDEWEFPMSKMTMDQTFFKAKLQMFDQLTGNQWKIKFFGSSPILHTIREFTPIERMDVRNKNQELKGVRSYFFGAYHWRGLPEMLLQKDDNTSDYNDWAWVPKKQMNKYFTKEYYDVFINVCKTR